VLHKDSVFRTLIIVFCIFFAAGSACAGESEAAPIDTGGIIKFYQKYISAADGARCPMYPSCSHYAQQCITKHGVIMGWVMAMDRLVRCGRDERHLAPTVVVSGSSLIYDPVENNDFWWSEK